ncbi:hypothetical protein BJ508DRAFT_380252 [Ascobolus immersus RN42]|uniref:Uncharacterized protein n=1 Tax=Ascobolus immersus RN42 TaxID=1160509 RepID=A0A3N4HZI2_ASCIM|nr:hypothetical protein BJ508DRAFT_380252 [Ascobolus immersus RN42]
MTFDVKVTSLVAHMHNLINQSAECASDSESGKSDRGTVDPGARYNHCDVWQLQLYCGSYASSSTGDNVGKSKPHRITTTIMPSSPSDRPAPFDKVEASVRNLRSAEASALNGIIPSATDPAGPGAGSVLQSEVDRASQASKKEEAVRNVHEKAAQLLDGLEADEGSRGERVHHLRKVMEHTKGAEKVKE